VTNDPCVARINKRNWDRLLLPIATLTAIFASILGVLANFWDAFTLPAFTLLAWFYLRLTTPKQGRNAVSIDGNPKVKALLKWLTFLLLLTGVWAFIDTVVFGKSLYAPIELPQIILFTVLFSLLLTGVMVIERRFPTTPAGPKDHA
jgi:hypothetical protein